MHRADPVGIDGRWTKGSSVTDVTGTDGDRAGAASPQAAGAANGGIDQVLLNEHLPLGVLVIDAAGEIRHVNRRATTLTGYTRDEVLGKSIVEFVEGDDIEFLVWAYRDMLRLGSPRIAEAFHLLAAPGALPAVFHCAAGKDRTGLVAALLLGSIGVLDEHIRDDYALTQDGMIRMRAWARHAYPIMFSAMADVPSAMLAALPEAIQVVLSDVRASHGSVRGFVESIGVSAAEIDHLVERLVA